MMLFLADTPDLSRIVRAGAYNIVARIIKRDGIDSMLISQAIGSTWLLLR